MTSWKEGIVKELHKGVRRNYPRRYVTIKGLNDLYQADLVEMRPYAKENKGYNYMLTMIDTFSKRGWAEPLKTKGGSEISKVLDKILKKMKKPMRYMQTDLGKEFYNKEVAEIFKKYNITHYSTYSDLKASIVERFNRTIKTWMWKEFSKRGNYEWLDLIKVLIKKYNSRVHRTIGMAPEVVNESNEKEVLKRIMTKNLPPKKKAKFKKGDTVRLSKIKSLFAKGYTPNWSTELFIIKEVQKTVPVTYKLKDKENGQDIAGGFYEQELQKTNYTDEYLVEKVIKNKGNKTLVKWLGFDSSHNSWIDSKYLE